MKTIIFSANTCTGIAKEEREFPDDTSNSEIDEEFLDWICMTCKVGWY